MHLVYHFQPKMSLLAGAFACYYINEQTLNTDESDLLTDMDSIAYGAKSIYAHFNIVSGPSNNEYGTFAVWKIDNSEDRNLGFEDNINYYYQGENGDNNYSYSYFRSDPSGKEQLTLPKGTYTISIYESITDTLLGKKTIIVDE